MKHRVIVFVLVLIALTNTSVCLADGTAQTNQPPQPESIVQITAEAEGLTRVDPTSLPTDSGSYWLVTSNGIMAPFPAPLFDSSCPVYAIVDDIYLVDGTEGQVAVLPDQIDGAQIMTDTGVN